MRHYKQPYTHEPGMTMPHEPNTALPLVEASIADLRRALEEGRTTAEALVSGYLARIAHYDHNGIRLNSVIVMNPDALDEARASDERRARGETLGPLDGIPYTAKDSYKVRGLTVAAGSPAFADLVASDDAFAIARLRAAGAVLIGLTNMPPMANGGVWVRPISTAPAARRRAMAKASSLATRSAKAGEPAATVRPRTL